MGKVSWNRDWASEPAVKTPGPETDAVLAIEFKLKRHVSRLIKEAHANGMSAWDVLDAVRESIGEPLGAAGARDGFTYAGMRRFIRRFNDQWGL